jgi:hypothetical protein
LARRNPAIKDFPRITCKTMNPKSVSAQMMQVVLKPHVQEMLERMVPAEEDEDESELDSTTSGAVANLFLKQMFPT